MNAGQSATAVHHGLSVLDAGVMEYRAAWDYQLAVHDDVLGGRYPDGALILLEHPPVITIGRHPGSEAHLLADAAQLATRGVDVVATDRGGDITFHGPGQLVAYPIIPLNKYNLRIHDYIRLLERAVIRTLAGLSISAHCQQGATGVWVHSRRLPPGQTAKICALGIKLRRWVSLHGIALNVTTDLTFFDLINPCGLGRPVTSLASEIDAPPSMTVVKAILAEQLGGELEAYSRGKTFQQSIHREF